MSIEVMTQALKEGQEILDALTVKELLDDYLHRHGLTVSGTAVYSIQLIESAMADTYLKTDTLLSQKESFKDAYIEALRLLNTGEITAIFGKGNLGEGQQQLSSKHTQEWLDRVSQYPGLKHSLRFKVE